MMRIALVCPNDLPVPAVRGGAVQITAWHLAQRFASHAHVTLVSPALSLGVRRGRANASDATGQPADGASGTASGGANPTLKTAVHHVRFPLRGYSHLVAGYFRRTPFDYIVVFNRPKWIPMFRIAAGRGKIILSMHTHRLGPSWSSLPDGSRAVDAADRIVTVSRFLARRIGSRFHNARWKLRVVHSGVDLDRFRPGWAPAMQDERLRLRRQLGWEHDRVVMFVGRLDPSKGAHVLLRAMARVVAHSPSARLVIVGGQWVRRKRPPGYVRQLKRLAAKLGSRVSFTGFIPPDQIHRYFAAADILVCPSQWEEPLARVLYEGMAAGLPIVTTARGGNPEVIRSGYNGRLVRAYRSPRALAAAVLEMVSKPEQAAKMGKTGRMMVEQNFGWHAAARRWRRLFRPLS